jgi:hypothetical protein
MTKPFEIRPMVVRHLLAGDDEQAQALAKEAQAGYAADFLPDLIEFPLVSSNATPRCWSAGMKKINTKLKNQWDLKKWRKKHEAADGEPAAQRAVQEAVGGLSRLRLAAS